MDGTRKDPCDFLPPVSKLFSPSFPYRPYWSLIPRPSYHLPPFFLCDVVLPLPDPSFPLSFLPNSYLSLLPKRFDLVFVRLSEESALFLRGDVRPRG